MKKIFILIAMLCMSISCASASDFDYHLSNVPHPMQADVWTVDWNTLKIASPSETDNIVIEHLSPKPEQVATVDCYTETEDGQRQIIQKRVYLYQNGGVEYSCKKSDFYAYTDCLLKRDENNLTTPPLHLPLFMSNINTDTQADGYVTGSNGVSKDRAIHFVLQEQNGQVYEGILASVELLNSKTDKDSLVKLFKDPDLTYYDGGWAYLVQFKNNTNKKQHKYYGVIVYDDELYPRGGLMGGSWQFDYDENGQIQYYLEADIYFFDVEIPANDYIEQGLSMRRSISSDNDFILIDFENQQEMLEMQESVPTRFVGSFTGEAIDENEKGIQWMKDNFGIEFKKRSLSYYQ